jgi:hypothetical protein
VSRLQQLPFGAPIPPGHQMPGAPALGQGGQQPILNVSSSLVLTSQAMSLPFPFAPIIALYLRGQSSVAGLFGLEDEYLRPVCLQK